MNLITAHAGVEHITSANIAIENINTFGAGNYVFAGRYKEFDADLQNKNTVRVYAGEGMMNGRHFEMVGAFEELPINSGAQSTYRHDLVCARYTMDDETGVETAELIVIEGETRQGAGIDPTYNNTPISEGANIYDFPLYRVIVEGVQSVRLEKLFTVSGTVGDRMEATEKYVDDVAADIDKYKTAIDGQVAILENAFNTSKESARGFSEQSKSYADDSKRYAQEAISAAEDRIAYVSGEQLNLNTEKGGVLLNAVHGNTWKSKNLLKPTLVTSTQNGVTCTANSDGTYTLNGKATDTCYFFLLPSNGFKLGKGTYKVIGHPKNGNTSYYIYTLDYKFGSDNVQDKVVTLTEDYTASLIIRVASGATITNEVVKPMLTIDTEATYADYEPYGIQSTGEMGFFDGEYIQGWYQNGEYKNDTTVVCSKTFYNIKAGERVRIIKPAISIIGSVGITWFDVNKNYISYEGATDSIKEAPANARYFTFNCFAKSGTITPQTAPKVNITIDGQYAVVINEHGNNIWDEQWELGDFYDSSGAEYASNTTIRSKNYISVKPNVTYFSHCPKTAVFYLYDQNKKYLGATNGKKIVNANTTVTMPNGAYFARIRIVADYGTTYNNDIAIIEGTSGNYTPYRSKDVFIPTPAPLNRVDSAHDFIFENDGSVVNAGVADLSLLTWAYDTTNKAWYTSGLTNFIKPSTTNLVCDYIYKDPRGGNNGIYVSSTGVIWLGNGSTTDIPKGGLVYETATTKISDKKYLQKINCGSVDLGNLAFNVYGSVSGVFWANLSSAKLNGKIVTSLYDYYTPAWSDTKDNVIAIHPSLARVYLRDTSCDSDISKLATKTKGIKAIYELATPLILEVSDETIRAMQKLESYEDKTYIETIDKYAKATLDIGFGSTDLAALSLQNYKDNQTTQEYVEESLMSTLKEKLLWQNPTPISEDSQAAMPAQAITLNDSISNYDYLRIEYTKGGWNMQKNELFVISKELGIELTDIGLTTDGQDLYLYTRSILISEKNMTVMLCYSQRFGQTPVETQFNLVPMKIYGIKRG